MAQFLPKGLRPSCMDIPFLITYTNHHLIFTPNEQQPETKTRGLPVFNRRCIWVRSLTNARNDVPKQRIKKRRDF